MPRSEVSNQLIRDQRREEILSAALNLFSQQGFFAVKTSDITHKAGVSQGLLYHYFPSKEAIFTELLNTAFQKMNQACQELESANLSARDKIKMAVSGLVKSLESGETARSFLLILQAAAFESIPQEARLNLLEQYKTPYQVMERIFAAGQREGSVKEGQPSQLAQLFWNTINGMALFRLVHPQDYESPNLELLESFFLKA